MIRDIPKRKPKGESDEPYDVFGGGAEKLSEREHGIRKTGEEINNRLGKYVEQLSSLNKQKENLATNDSGETESQRRQEQEKEIKRKKEDILSKIVQVKKTKERKLKEIDKIKRLRNSMAEHRKRKPTNQNRAPSMRPSSGREA